MKRFWSASPSSLHIEASGPQSIMSTIWLRFDMSPRASVSSSSRAGRPVCPGTGASGARVGSPPEGSASSYTIGSYSCEGVPGGAAAVAGGGTTRCMIHFSKGTMSAGRTPAVPLLAAARPTFRIRADAYSIRACSAGIKRDGMVGTFTAGSGVAFTSQLTFITAEGSKV